MNETLLCPYPRDFSRRQSTMSAKFTTFLLAFQVARSSAFQILISKARRGLPVESGHPSRCLATMCVCYFHVANLIRMDKQTLDAPICRRAFRANPPRISGRTAAVSLPHVWSSTILSEVTITTTTTTTTTSISKEHTLQGAA